MKIPLVLITVILLSSISACSSSPRNDIEATTNDSPAADYRSTQVFYQALERLPRWAFVANSDQRSFYRYVDRRSYQQAIESKQATTEQPQLWIKNIYINADKVSYISYKTQIDCIKKTFNDQNSAYQYDHHAKLIAKKTISSQPYTMIPGTIGGYTFTKVCNPALLLNKHELDFDEFSDFYKQIKDKQ